MSEIGSFGCDQISAESLQQATHYSNQFDVSQIKLKNKAAGAFAVWVTGLISLKSVKDVKMPKVDELNKEAVKDAEEFKEKQEGLMQF